MNKNAAFHRLIELGAALEPHQLDAVEAVYVLPVGLSDVPGNLFALSSHRRLFLDGKRFVDEDAGCFRFLPLLRYLNMDCCSVTEPTLEHLAHTTALESFSARSSSIENALFETLIGHPAMRSLQLSQTQIGDEALRYISKMPQIDLLGLSHTHVTNSGLMHFSGMSNLLTIDVRNTKVTSAGRDHFLQAVRQTLPDIEVLF